MKGKAKNEFLNEEFFIIKENKDLNIQELTLKNDKIHEIPSFIRNKINRIIVTANTLTLLKLSDSQHYNICFHESFKFQLFFDYPSLKTYEKNMNEMFLQKEGEIVELLRKFEV